MELDLNALIPFTGCALCTIVMTMYGVYIIVYVCLYVVGIVYYCTVELCEGGGGGSGSVLLLKGSC